jgi:hypothetical protein
MVVLATHIRLEMLASKAPALQKLGLGRCIDVRREREGRSLALGFLSTGSRNIALTLEGAVRSEASPDFLNLFANKGVRLRNRMCLGAFQVCLFMRRVFGANSNICALL